MKFLPKDLTYNDIIPLNFIYANGTDFTQPDVLTIIFKDNITGKKMVHHIENPEIEVYIAKANYRDPENPSYYDYCRDWFPIDECDKYRVHYRNRWSEIGKILGITKEQARQSPYVFNADIDIENYYLMNFVIEYPSETIPTITSGFLDIENDIIDCVGFPEYGQTPINLVTYIDGERKISYTFILCKDNLHPNMTLRKDLDYQTLKDNFYKQVDYFLSHQDEFQKKIHDMFDASYGDDFQYHFLTYDNEISLMKDLWKIIHAHENDYIQIWNEPYDIQNLILRPGMFGVDPNEIIQDERISIRFPVSFKEDTNPMAHKRKHSCVTYTLSTFVDDMVHYAGIRSGRGKLPSTKLNYVAEIELNDSKLDYSESGDIKHLFYLDFETAIIYNLKDVLLQYGIERKTRDLNTIYNRMYKNMCLPSQSFTTTLLVKYTFAHFALERGYVLGVNRNKFKKEEGDIDYKKVLAAVDEIDENAEIDLIDFVYDDEEDDDYEEDDDNGTKKRKKYQGAYVMNPEYMSPSGTVIMGEEAKYVHEYVADEDIGSEYPTAAATCNISNETLVGKVFVDDADDINIPIYDSFVFKGDEKAKYKIDKSNFLLDAYSEKQYIELGKIYMDLPDVSEILEEIENNIEEYK